MLRFDPQLHSEPGVTCLHITWDCPSEDGELRIFLGDKLVSLLFQSGEYTLVPAKPIFERVKSTVTFKRRSSRRSSVPGRILTLTNVGPVHHRGAGRGISTTREFGPRESL
jgi:hypothetical protein